MSSSCSGRSTRRRARPGSRSCPISASRPDSGTSSRSSAIEGMDEVDSVKIRCGGLPLDPQPPLGYALFFSIHGLLNEYCGRVGLPAGRTDRPDPYPDRIGVDRVPRAGRHLPAVHTSGGSSTLPWTLEGRVRHLDYKTVRYPGHWPRIRFLKELGSTRDAAGSRRARHPAPARNRGVTARAGARPPRNARHRSSCG